MVDDEGNTDYLTTTEFDGKAVLHELLFVLRAVDESGFRLVKETTLHEIMMEIGLKYE